MDEEEEIKEIGGTTGPTLKNMKGPFPAFFKALGDLMDNAPGPDASNTRANALRSNRSEPNILGEGNNTVPEPTTDAAPDTSVTADIQESTLQNQQQLSRGITNQAAGDQSRAGGLIGFKPQFEGQTLGQFIRGEDTQQQATFTGVDAQGRLRQFTPEGQLADSYSGFEAESQAREARIGQAPGVGGAGSAFRDRDLDPSGRFKPSGSAVGTGISMSDARNIVDPEGKMSNQVRTAAAREYIRQQELKASETQRGIEEQERAEARQAQKDLLEKRNIESLIASRQADEPEMSLRELIDETDDLNKKINNNTATPDEINRYNTNAMLLQQKNIEEYQTVDTGGNQGDSGYTQKQESDIKLVMDGNNISREKAISAMKAAGKL